MRKRTAFNAMIEKTSVRYGNERPNQRYGYRITARIARVVFVIEQMREPFPDVAGLVEMAGHALGAPSDRKGKAAKIGHDRKHRFRR